MSAKKAAQTMAGSLVEVRTWTTTYRGRLVGGSVRGRGPGYLYLTDPVGDPDTPFMALLFSRIKSVRVLVEEHLLPTPGGARAGWLAEVRPWYRA